MDKFGSFADMSGEGYWQEPDFLLSNLVSLMANKLESQLGITLLVKGMMLTGTLVGEREYLSTVNELFKEIAQDAIGTPTKEDMQLLEESFTFDELTDDIYPEDYDEDDAASAVEDFDITMIRHLHLKDPVIISPQGMLSLTESPLPIMRIRLTQVDGWLVGRMALIDDADDDRDFRLPDNGVRH